MDNKGHCGKTPQQKADEAIQFDIEAKEYLARKSGSDVEKAAIKYSKQSDMMPKGTQNIWEIDAFKAGASYQSQRMEDAELLLFNAFIKSLIDSNGYTMTEIKAKDTATLLEAYAYWKEQLTNRYYDYLPKV